LGAGCPSTPGRPRESTGDLNADFLDELLHAAFQNG
jgi:hypothetical protein